MVSWKNRVHWRQLSFYIFINEQFKELPWSLARWNCQWTMNCHLYPVLLSRLSTSPVQTTVGRQYQYSVYVLNVLQLLEYRKSVSIMLLWGRLKLWCNLCRNLLSVWSDDQRLNKGFRQVLDSMLQDILSVWSDDQRSNRSFRQVLDICAKDNYFAVEYLEHCLHRKSCSTIIFHSLITYEYKSNKPFNTYIGKCINYQPN